MVIRTNRLLSRIGSTANIRLLEADRLFFADLAKTGMISEKRATSFHYAVRKKGARQSLARLVNAGILSSKIIHTHNGQERIYKFASDKVAKQFGGRLWQTGINRSDHHDLLVSESYFELNRPADFKLAQAVNRHDLFEGLSQEKRTLPDAIYTNSDGEMVFIESDAGHYTTKQIREKQQAWGAVKQVWVQPSLSHAVIRNSNNVTVIKI